MESGMMAVAKTYCRSVDPTIGSWHKVMVMLEERRATAKLGKSLVANPAVL
jgi:hypothetical protein